MADQQSAEREGLSGVMTWILNNPAPSLTIFAVVLYAAFRAMYLIYYGRFGVTPEEIGLDYLGILVNQTSLGLIVILPVILLGLYARVRLTSFQKEMDTALSDPTTIRAQFPELSEEKEDHVVIMEYRKIRGEYLEKTRKMSRWYAGFIIILTIGFLGIAFQSALSAGTEARNPTIDAFFQGRAIPVTVLWLNPSGDESQPRSISYLDLGVDGLADTTPEFLLLGSKDGLVVLYDQKLGAVRLPRDEVILVSSPSP